MIIYKAVSNFCDGLNKGAWEKKLPYHTIPYHTIPYHTIPYHTIPYHTKVMSLVGEWYGDETDLIYGVQITVKSPLEKSKLTLWTSQQEHGNQAVARLKCVVYSHIHTH